VKWSQPHNKGEKMNILAAIPCFNEEAAIGTVVLKARKHVDNVLVVDDGSTDSTVEVARNAGAEVISHGANVGKGGAVKTIFKYAFENDVDILVLLDGDGQHNPDDVDILVLLDGDGQHNPDEIPNIIKPIKEEYTDLVLGFRDFSVMPFYRRIGRAVLDITTGISGTVTDSQSGFRALSRKAIQSMAHVLNGNDFSIESEMILAAKELNLAIKEAPISCRYEGVSNKSTKNPVSHGFGVLNSLIWLIAEKRPMLFIGVPGFVFVVIGIFMGIRTLQLYFSIVHSIRMQNEICRNSN
jgi:glycosyltransferase involved in cell wall biosynthesis